MVKSPILWTVDNRFWLNSKYVCLLLGIQNFQDRKIENKNPTGTTLRNCTMTESLNFLNEAKIRRLSEEKARLEKHVIFGNLQIPKETLRKAVDPPKSVLDSPHKITKSPTGSFYIKNEIPLIASSSVLNQDIREIRRIQEIETCDSTNVQNILRKLQENNAVEKVNNLKNLQLSNKDWKLLIDMSAGGDTIDS